MIRYRLVSRQNDGEPHISSVVLGASEVEEQLKLETLLHLSAGWTVTPGEKLLVCRRRGTTRVISAQEYTPFNDSSKEE